MNFLFFLLLGLFGPLLICKKGSLDSKNKQKNVDKEFVLHFVVTLEKNSWYYDDNKELAGDPSSIDESMYSLGLYCNVIGFQKIFFVIFYLSHVACWEKALEKIVVSPLLRKDLLCERACKVLWLMLSLQRNFQRLTWERWFTYLVYLFRIKSFGQMSTTICSTETT